MGPVVYSFQARARIFWLRSRMARVNIRRCTRSMRKHDAFILSSKIKANTLVAFLNVLFSVYQIHLLSQDGRNVAGDFVAGGSVVFGRPISWSSIEPDS